VAALDGTPTDELDALTTNRGVRADFRTDHPLTHLSWEYAVRVSQFIAARPSSWSDHSPPAPLEVVAWFHVRIHMKLSRALVGQALTARGTLDRREDARGCAKLTLVSVQRSRAALRCLFEAGVEREVDTMVALLDALEQGVDQQFPDARAYIRVGLDVPVG
jgi:hypothetical protein